MPSFHKLKRAMAGGSDSPTNSTTRSSSISESNSSNESSTLPQTNTLQTTPTVASSSSNSAALEKKGSRLSKRLTWGRSDDERVRKEEEKERKRKEKEWEAFAPKKYLFLRSSKEREGLRGWEWKFRGRESLDNRRGSGYSGISPGTSRMGSVDEGHLAKILEGNGAKGEQAPMSV